MRNAMIMSQRKRLALLGALSGWLVLAAVRAIPAVQHAGAQLVILDLDTATCRQFTEDPEWNHGSPAWSHDGQWLAYDRWRLHTDASGSQIHIRRVEGGEPRELGAGGMPDWSPDDRQIAFHSFADRGMSIEIMSRSGAGRETLQFAAGSPRWSADGRFLAFVDVKNSNLSTLDLVTMQVRTLLPEGWRPSHGLGWSPDGQQICFRLSGYRNEPDALVIARVGDSEPIVRLKGDLGAHFAWSPDGKQILGYQRDEEKAPWQLMQIPVDGTTEPIPVQGQPTGRNNVDMAWSPDGKQIVFASFSTSDK